MKLLEELIKIQGASSDEGRIKEFILQYVLENQNKWKVKPEIFEGNEFQDNLTCN